LLDRLHGRGVLVAYVDVFRTTTPAQLLELTAGTILCAAESRPERLLRLAMDLLGRLRPQVGADATGRPTLSLDIGTSPRSLLALQEEVLALPERLAMKRKRRLVLAFDEFQEILRFPGAGLEKAMRSHFQRHRHVSYLFAGSRQTTLQDMATRERSPFYKFGRVMSLGSIPPEEFTPFLEARFKRGGLAVTQEVLDAVLAAADDVPYNVQRLCHQVWSLRAGKATRLTERDIGEALSTVLQQDAPHFSAAWERLSLHQRQLVQAIAQGGGRHVFSRGFLTSHRLGSHSSVQTSLRLLLKEQVLFKTNGEYRIADPFFREWIGTRTV